MPTTSHSSSDDIETCLSGFSAASSMMDLNVAWPKTKVKASVRVQLRQMSSLPGNTSRLLIRPVSWQHYRFVRYTCRPDMLRRLGISSSAMNSLSKVWSSRLSLVTKLRIYQTCVVPLSLYRSDTWTLLKADACRLQAFHMHRTSESQGGERWCVRSATYIHTCAANGTFWGSSGKIRSQMSPSLRKQTTYHGHHEQSALCPVRPRSKTE
jgi:hypothetical protein